MKFQQENYKENRTVMRKSHLKVFFIFLFLNIIISGFSQETPDNIRRVAEILDSLKKAGVILSDKQEPPQISLSADQSIRFLQERNQPQYWKNTQDPLRIALGQLVFQASNLPYDSAEYFLRNILLIH